MMLTPRITPCSYLDLAFPRPSAINWRSGGQLPRWTVTQHYAPSVRLVLVDYSAARVIAAAAIPFHHGTLRYASKRVLDHVAEVKAQQNTELLFHLLPADDVESLCRCILAAKEAPPLTMDPATLQQYWQDVECTPTAAELMEACRKEPLEYDAVVKLSKYFANRRV